MPQIAPLMLALLWMGVAHAAEPIQPSAPIQPGTPMQPSVPALPSAPVKSDTPVKSGKPGAVTPAPGWLGSKTTPYGPMLIQQAPPPPYRDYQMNRILSAEDKKRWMQMAMPMMGNMMKMDAREAMNYFAVKYKVKPGITFDEVVESMMLRANQVNLKFVGSNLMWKDFKAVLGDDVAPRVEAFSFCDIAVGRDLLRVIPEMAVFLPCRITVMEDADKNIWVMTLDWDVMWLDNANAQMGITPELRKGAIDIRNKLDSVMRAGANGEL